MCRCCDNIDGSCDFDEEDEYTIFDVISDPALLESIIRDDKLKSILNTRW